MSDSLIIGGMSFLGKYLHHWLNFKGQKVAITTSKNLITETGQGGTIYTGIDVNGPAFYSHIFSIFDIERPYTVYYLPSASSGATDSELFETNVIGFNKFISFLATKGRARNIVLASSDQVYGVSPYENTGWGETSLPSPISYYGTTKLIMEKLLEATCKKFPHIKGVVVRLGGLVGENMSHGLLKSIYETVTNRDIFSKKEFVVRGKQWQSTIRNYIDVNDAAKFMVDLPQILTKDNFHVVNVANPYPISTDNMLRIVEQILEKKIDVKYTNDPHKSIVLDTFKARQLGLVTTQNEEMIKMAILGMKNAK